MDLISYQSFLDSLVIVLVLYKSDLEASESFQSLDACFKATNASADIFIYDNSPQRLALVLDRYNCKIHYVWDDSNPGVSKAYNEGFRFGEKNGKEWLLLLDQDTKFESNFLAKYHDAHISNPEISLLAPILELESGEIYSPCEYKFPRTSLLKKVDPGVINLQKISILNSGMLVSLKTFKEVGGYDERLKMDFTDFEFMDRYRKIRDSFLVVGTTGIHGFSGFQDEIGASLARFNRYCQSFVIMCSIRHVLSDKIVLIAIALIRAIKLSLKFKSTDFISIFCKSFTRLNKNVA